MLILHTLSTAGPRASNAHKSHQSCAVGRRRAKAGEGQARAGNRHAKGGNHHANTTKTPQKLVPFPKNPIFPPPPPTPILFFPKNRSQLPHFFPHKTHLHQFRDAYVPASLGRPGPRN
jgi:hypothetical protein